MYFHVALSGSEGEVTGRGIFRLQQARELAMAGRNGAYMMSRRQMGFLMTSV